MSFSRLLLLCLVMGLLMPTLPAVAISINITYDDQLQDLRSSGVFNAAEKAVIQQAAAQWQTAITSAGNINITMLKSTLLGSLLGFASNYQTNVGDTDIPLNGRLNGTPTSGTVQVDDRMGDAFTFWVDPTPAANDEFHNGNTNYQFLANPGPANNGYDMLSLVQHEIGHVLGFSSSFDNFYNGEVQSPAAMEGARWLYAFAAAPKVGPQNQYMPGIFPFGGVYLREGDDPTSPYPSHVDELMPPPAPSRGPGTAAGFFPDDLLNPSLAIGERTMVSDVDLSILADAYGYTVIPEPGTLVLLATSLTTLLAYAWRRRRS